MTCKLKFIDSFRFISTSLKVLLITYLKFTKKNANDSKKEESNFINGILLGLKIINKTTNEKNVKRDG